jgi:sugar lactone lactonase YvrE
MKFTLLFILAFFTFQCLAQAQIITTVAGGGTADPGDGGVAQDAKLRRPTGVAVDVVGNLYICDRNANKLRKVATDGIITTIAGTGTAGYSGDGGPAALAMLKNPYSIAIDGANNIYIGDQSGVVRKINTSGIISTYAGVTTPGFSGDGGPATAAQLNGPSGLAFDLSGNMYIADIDNNRIRKINPMGIITTIAGTGATLYNGENIPATDANLYSPSGVAVDNSGNIYITDSRNQRIRKINPSGMITTIAGSGILGFSGDGSLAIFANLNNPIGICVNNSGEVYFSDVLNMRIRKIDNSGVISTVAGNGLSGSDGDGGDPLFASISSPIGICLSNAGNMYIAMTDRVREIERIVSIVSSHNHEEQGLKIYPNPNTGNFTVNISTMGQNTASIVITDITGSVVKNMPFHTNEPIPITIDAPGGLYVITAFTDDGVISQKITLLK